MKYWSTGTPEYDIRVSQFRTVHSATLGTFITFCHQSSISILVRMCVQDRPVESEDTVLPGTVFRRNITVVFATLVARRVV